ncbi:MAG: hypothetical protein R3E97_20005 [Candidatus Eisenbacteria bacterium]
MNLPRIRHVVLCVFRNRRRTSKESDDFTDTDLAIIAGTVGSTGAAVLAGATVANSRSSQYETWAEIVDLRILMLETAEGD